MSQDLHVAIIMDGNGRWAQQRGKNRLEGHREGVNALKRIVKACPSQDIRYLTVFAFSSENWNRPATEVSGLMSLLKSYLQSEIKELHKEHVCLRVIGERKRLSSRIVSLIEEAEALTKDNTRLGLQIALSYGARDEITRACQKIALLVAEGKLDADKITSDHIIQNLDTYSWPDPDLLIRTSGEMRVSNFLLWQLCYTELYFSQKYWPDFREEDLKEAIEHFKQRSRRFGSIKIA